MTRTRPLSNVFRAFLLLALALPVCLLLLTLQSGRLVPPARSLDAREVATIEELLLENAPPDVATSNLQRLSLDETQLNLLLRYGFQLFVADGRPGAEITVPDDQLVIFATAPVTAWPVETWMNMEAGFGSVDGVLQLQSLTLGHLALPAALVNSAGEILSRRFLAENPELTEILASVQQIGVAQGRLAVDLQWRPELVSRLRSQAQQYFAGAGDRERILHYYEKLAQLVRGLPADRTRVSLHEFLVPMFSEARYQSAVSGDPVAENRTVLQALAIYASGQSIAEMLSLQDLEEARKVELRLQRREDLAQHLLSSAAIAAAAGPGIAAVLANTKEAYDARYRTGFSFSDVMANKAGMVLGNTAVASPSMALELQERIVNSESETEYFPELPRGSNRDALSESDFTDRYTDRNSERYRKRVAEIEALVNERPLFRDLQTHSSPDKHAARQ